jgi:hypothetical protein
MLLTPAPSSFAQLHLHLQQSFVLDNPTMSRSHLPPLETSKAPPTPISPTRRYQVQRSVSEFSAFPKLHRPHNHHHHHHHHHSSRHHKDHDVAQSAGPSLQLNGEAVSSKSENATPNDSRDASRRTSVLGSRWEDGEKDKEHMILRDGQVADEKQKGTQRAMWAILVHSAIKQRLTCDQGITKFYIGPKYTIQ